MGCCWAGDDGRFNNYEKARALGIYLTLPIASFIVWYIVFSFYRTRNHVEMAVREPKAMIMCILTIWMCIVFEALGHLAWDLELAKFNWDEFRDREKVSVSSIFYFLASAGYVFSGTISLYRIWMFYHRSELNRIALICGEAAVKIGKINLNQSMCMRMRNSMRTRRKVMAVCFIWAFIVIFPLFLINFILSTYQKSLQRLSIVIFAVTTIPMFLFMVVLVRIVKNNYGVVEEYKMALAALICSFGIRYSLTFTGFAESYYSGLIDWECRAGLTCAYFIYVMYVVRKFDVQSKSLAAIGLCGKLLNCRKSSSSLNIMETKSFEDFTLPQLLSNSLGYKLFLAHVQDTLSTENLFCFVDIYRHRKSLTHDPFLELTESENGAVYASLARIKMHWIDMEMIRKPSVVLTCMEIYRLYFKQSSIMEINIPGMMRKQLANVFGQKRSRKSSTRKQQGDKGISQDIIARTSNQGTQCNIEIFSLSRTIPPFNQKTVRSTVRSSPEDNLSANYHHHFAAQRSSSTTETQPSIENMYSAWKAVINLLNKDSLVRFNMAVDRKSELDEIRHPT